MIKLPLYQSSGTETDPGLISLNVNGSQLWLIITGLELLYDEDLTREHFDKTDLDDCLKEADDIRALIDFLKSFASAPEGGEG